MPTLEILWANRSHWRLHLRMLYFLHRRSIKIAGAVLLLLAAIIAWLAVGV